MLNPQAMGILAQLVLDSLIQHPLDPHRFEYSGEAPPDPEPWEVDLISKIRSIPELPDYVSLAKEVAIFVDYYSFHLESASHAQE